MKQRGKVWRKAEKTVRKEVKRAIECENERETGSSERYSGKIQSVIFERDVVGTDYIISPEVFWSPERWALYQDKVLWFLSL